MTSRNRLISLIAAAYFLPVLALSLYASLIFSSSHSFGVFSVGTLLASAGSIFLFLIDPPQQAVLPLPAKNDVAAVPIPVCEIDHSRYEEQAALIEEYQQHIQALSRQIESQQQSIQELNKSKEELKKKAEEEERDYRSFQESVKEQQDQYRVLLHEHQQTINEQRDTLEKKQQQIVQLEGQVRDLHYEIKTLMDVEERQSIIRFPLDRYRQKEVDYSLPPVEEEEEAQISAQYVEGPEEASQQLRRCLDIAQKITGGHYMHNRPSRLKDLPVENTALEMRRLFDNLRSENQATILLYSPRDNRLLFVNNPIKSLLGWTPERFVHQFSDLLTDGGEAWKHSISQLAFKNEAQTTLWLTAKSGHHVSLSCHLGLIPTGSFRHFVLGVLYPAK